MIEIRHLRKEYPMVVPLKDVNAVINDGEIISVIGPSGTGKSTLIRCINLLERPTSGQIIIDGQDITGPGVNISEVRKKAGMVFQNFNLFAHMTVIENIMFGPMKLLGKSAQDAYDKALELLGMVGMEARAMDYPDVLSGGQKQRVAIARTLAMDPEILLFDEPTSALDPTMVKEVQSVISELTQMKKTMIIVTHEMKFAKEISSRVFYLDQGCIYEEGSPRQIFGNPEKDLTRRFIRQLETYETYIDSPKFDFRNAVSSLEAFGYKNRIPIKTLYRIQSVFEELCQQILLPYQEEPKILFAVEYDEKKELATAIIKYAGKAFEPHTSENSLALSIVNSQIESMAYSMDASTELCNKIVLNIR